MPLRRRHPPPAFDLALRRSNGFEDRNFSLDIISIIDKYENMKIFKPLPLPRLEANETHVEAFKALAHLRRLEVFFFLVQARREVPAGEIQEALKVPGPTLSRHLDLLRRAGLIQSRKEERYIYYSVKREMASQLARLLTACC
jgi:DNA-binding transcriptional ArsR family regulator